MEIELGTKLDVNRIMKPRIIMLLALCLCVVVTRAIASGDYPNGSGGINALQQRDKPYLVLVSIDGFNWDYMDKYPTPNLDRLAITGSKAERLIPVYPTLTFPNHYSIATGLYPANHGIVANSFPDKQRDRWYFIHDREMVEDPSFYAGEPIWVTAETQGMVSAAFYFVGTEAAIQGVSPSHWRSYDDDVPGEARVDQVLDWLAFPESTRPHLYTLYFEDVDDHSHSHGRNSSENVEAIKRVDSYIGRLLEGIDRLPYKDRINIIVVSDHGQGAYLENQQPFIVGDHVGLDEMTLIEGGSYLFMHFDQADEERAGTIADTINENWAHGSAYLSSTAPAGWKVDDSPRFPDVMLIPDQGYAVLSSNDKVGKINAGDHGWAPGSADMHGLFIASGANIKAGVELGEVNNIDIYPLMVSILGLAPAAKLDGDPKKLADLLKPDP